MTTKTITQARKGTTAKPVASFRHIDPIAYGKDLRSKFVIGQERRTERATVVVEFVDEYLPAFTAIGDDSTTRNLRKRKDRAETDISLSAVRIAIVNRDKTVPNAPCAMALYDTYRKLRSDCSEAEAVRFAADHCAKVKTTDTQKVFDYVKGILNPKAPKA